MNKYTVAVIGAGSRGHVYASEFNKKDEFSVVAACDYYTEQLEKMKDSFGISDDNLFLDEEEFFKEKRADVLVIATCDSYHVRQCIRAMKLGYDVLLEKPISDSKEEIADLLKTQKETGRKIVVCHVMRYNPAIKKIEEILSSGVLGKLLAIDHIERVRFWHQAQAYVRIQKMFADTQHPTILAKCCHDLDLIQHFIGARCESVSSVGGLGHFRRENAPKDSTQRCLDCPHQETCNYSAKRIYIDMWKEWGCPESCWPFFKVCFDRPITEEGIIKGLRTKTFGECVFKCDVEENPHVVDHQMVQMQFENGVVANLKMMFTARAGRRINFFGTEGEIVFDEIPGTIEVKPYFGEVTTYNIKDLAIDDSGHGGGDGGLINAMHDILEGKSLNYTSLEESVESHLIGICAEESRLDGGKVVYVHKGE